MENYLEDFFGLELLKKHKERASALNLASYGGWLDKNVQTRRFDKLPEGKRKLIGVCPHYALLEAVAEILLIKPEEFVLYEEFCGLILNTNRGRFESYGSSHGYDLVVAACNAFDLVLATALNYVQMEVPPNVRVDEKT